MIDRYQKEPQPKTAAMIAIEQFRDLNQAFNSYHRQRQSNIMGNFAPALEFAQGYTDYILGLYKMFSPSPAKVEKKQVEKEVLAIAQETRAGCDKNCQPCLHCPNERIGDIPEEIPRIWELLAEYKQGALCKGSENPAKEAHKEIFKQQMTALLISRHELANMVEKILKKI